MKPKISIKIISDIVCPWCYIGKTRLQKAIDRSLDQYDFSVSWHPYQLYPHVPVGGISKKELQSRRPVGTGKSIHDIALQDDLIIDYRTIDWFPNTLQAHRMMHLIDDQSLKTDFCTRLYQRYFNGGGDVEGLESLASVAKEVGVSQYSIGKFLFSEEGSKEVVDEIMHWKNKGVTQVPAFIFNDKQLIIGAQLTENFIRYFQRIQRLETK